MDVYDLKHKQGKKCGTKPAIHELSPYEQAPPQYPLPPGGPVFVYVSERHGTDERNKKKIENCHRNILGHPVALSVCMCERDTELIIEIKNN